MKKRFIPVVAIFLALVCLPAFSQATKTTNTKTAAPTLADAEKFMAQTEVLLEDLAIKGSRAAWVQSNFITDDTEALSAKANQRSIDFGVQLAKEAAKYDGVEVPAEERRKLELFKRGLTLAAPSDPKESAEVTKLAANLEATYGKGKY